MFRSLRGSTEPRCHRCASGWNTDTPALLPRHRPPEGCAQKETIMPRRPWFLATALAAGCALSAPAANAQAPSTEAPPAQQPQAQQPQKPDLSDQKLDATAAAVERVASLRRDYQGRIAAASPSDQKRLTDEALGAMAKAVTDQGLTVEEYASILEVAQNDSSVLEKIRQRLPSKK
jgi:Domain of unknown function (DUF4168)